MDELLEDVAQSLEGVHRERADFAERVRELEAEASKHIEAEALLRSTLISAERAAQDMKEQARRESDLIVQEAHAEAREVTRQSAAEQRRIEEDLLEVRGMLRTALEVLAERRDTESAVEQPAMEPTRAEELAEDGIRKIAG